MMTYLINSTLCSALLLLAYQLLLKNKAMHGFKRAYLITSLLFSYSVPLIAVDYNFAPLQSVQPVKEQLLPAGITIVEARATAAPLITATEEVDYSSYIYIGIYSLITGLLLFRFIRNLYAIRLMIVNNEKTQFGNAHLVLISKKLTPHNFLNYIFLNKDEYQQCKIEDDILKHELAHASQHHSVDIILIELLFTICWFNPALLLYKKAMQLNHEFMADAAVLQDHNSISNYQYLLISKAEQFSSLNITSSFNYSITKKRLIMMSKKTKNSTAWLTRLAIAPVMAAAFLLFCNATVETQQEPAVKKKAVKPTTASSKNKPAKATPAGAHEISFNNYPYTQNGVSKELIAEYDKISSKYYKPESLPYNINERLAKEDQARMEEIYKQMNRAQQKNQRIGFIKPSGIPMAKDRPTQKQLDLWKNPSIYGVWVDDKRIKNDDLENYSPEQFDWNMVSKLSKTAINYNHHKYQVNLMTKKRYAEYVKTTETNKNFSIYYYQNRQFRTKKANLKG